MGSIVNCEPTGKLSLSQHMEISPMVNQVETHVFNQQAASRKYMDEFDCRIMSWGPLTEGRNGLFTNPVLAEIGRKHGKPAAQIALRFLLQDGVTEENGGKRRKTAENGGKRRGRFSPLPS